MSLATRTANISQALPSMAQQPVVVGFDCNGGHTVHPWLFIVDLLVFVCIRGFCTRLSNPTVHRCTCVRTESRSLGRVPSGRPFCGSRGSKSHCLHTFKTREEAVGINEPRRRPPMRHHRAALRDILYLLQPAAFQNNPVSVHHEFSCGRTWQVYSFSRSAQGIASHHYLAFWDYKVHPWYPQTESARQLSVQNWRRDLRGQVECTLLDHSVWNTSSLILTLYFPFRPSGHSAVPLGQTSSNK